MPPPAPPPPQKGPAPQKDAAPRPVSATVPSRPVGQAGPLTTIRIPSRKGVVKAVWGKPAVLPVIGEDASADACQVEMRVETRGYAEGTPAELTVHALEGDVRVGAVGGNLLVRGNRVVDEATQAPPLWRFTREHHEKGAWLSKEPLYVFRVKLAGQDAGASPKEKGAALRLLFRVACVGNPTGDLAGADAEPGVVAEVFAKDAAYGADTVAGKYFSIADYGKHIANAWILHHAGHGMTLCKSRRRLNDERDRDVSKCPTCGSTSVHADVEGVVLINGICHRAENLHAKVPVTPRPAAAAASARGIVLDESPAPGGPPPAPGGAPGGAQAAPAAPPAPANAPAPAPAAPPVAVAPAAAPIVDPAIWVGWGRVPATPPNFLGPGDVAALPNAPKALAFWNCCDTQRSKALANALHARGTRHVIGWSYPVNDTVAKEAARAFYRVWLGTYKGDPAQVPRAFAQVLPKVKAQSLAEGDYADWKLSSK